MLHNIPKEIRPQLLCNGSLKSCKTYYFFHTPSHLPPKSTSNAVHSAGPTLLLNYTFVLIGKFQTEALYIYVHVPQSHQEL